MDNHQLLNAQYYESMGCCWIIEQDNFNSTNLFNLIMKIIEDKKKLMNVRNNMKKNITKDVYIKIENEIQEFINK